jgi:hypothetical protein
MDCIYCGDEVEGWYEYRWRDERKEGPICQACWIEDFPVPGYSSDRRGGVNYPEEASPAFHVWRRDMIERRGRG